MNNNHDIAAPRNRKRAGLSLSEALKLCGGTISSWLETLGFPTTPPIAGSGVHSWIWHVSLRTKNFPIREVCSFIESATQNCGRFVPAKEIEEALRNARREDTPASLLNCRRNAHPKWPEFDKDLSRRHAQIPDALSRFRQNSPCGLADSTPRQILPRLFSQDDLICVGKCLKRAFTLPLREILEKEVTDQLPLVVPNPMSKLEGFTQNGNLSPRSLDNTGPRKFLVVEFDQAELTKEMQASILLHLTEERAPLAMVVDSGRRSLHGWFSCRGVSPLKLEDFMQYAVQLGADPHTWTPCQFVRMPGGIRDNGAYQRVHFLNKNLISKHA